MAANRDFAMPRIRQIDVALIDRLFDMEGGYVLRFSDRTMREFFANDLNIDIDDPQYVVDGSSKARRLRCFLRLVDGPTAVRVLNALWEHRQTDRQLHDETEDTPNTNGQFLGLIDRIQGKGTATPEPQTPPGSAVPAFDTSKYAGLIAELVGLHATERVNDFDTARFGI
jgi:hypothetical protein